MNYLLYRALENSYANLSTTTKAKQHTQTEHTEHTENTPNVFIEMTMNRFFIHNTEFDMYRQWDSRKTWASYQTMVRQIYDKLWQICIDVHMQHKDQKPEQIRHNVIDRVQSIYLWIHNAPPNVIPPMLQMELNQFISLFHVSYITTNMSQFIHDAVLKHCQVNEQAEDQADQSDDHKEFTHMDDMMNHIATQSVPIIPTIHTHTHIHTCNVCGTTTPISIPMTITITPPTTTTATNYTQIQQDCDMYRTLYTTLRHWFVRQYRVNTVQQYIEHIEHNPFLGAREHEEFHKYYRSMYKMKHGFQRLVSQWRWKRTPLYDNAYTLSMDSIDELSSSRRILLLEGNTRYAFDCLELAKLWVQSITAHDQMFLEPAFPKNPYTNLPLSTHSLWRVYWHLRFHGFRVHPLIDACVHCEMDLERFECEHEGTLRNMSIRKELNDLTESIRKPFPSHTQEDKERIRDIYHELIQYLYGLTQDTVPISPGNSMTQQLIVCEAMDYFYHHGLSGHHKRARYIIVKSAMSILKHWYFSRYSYHPYQQRVEQEQTKQVALSYLRSIANPIEKWYYYKFKVHSSCISNYRRLTPANTHPVQRIHTTDESNAPNTENTQNEETIIDHDYE